MSGIKWLIFICLYKRSLKKYNPDWENSCQYEIGCMECDGAYCKSARLI